MNEKFEDIRKQVIAKAWKDPAFKKKLQTNPKDALKECGFSLPENINVKVIEDSPNTFTFVIPALPKNSNNLSEEELVKIAGAGTGNTNLCPELR